MLNSCFPLSHIHYHGCYTLVLTEFEIFEKVWKSENYSFLDLENVVWNKWEESKDLFYL